MKISVLVPVYKLENFVGPCLESLLTQETDFPFEVIAVDDASPDASWTIIEDLAKRHPTLRAYRNPVNLGLAGTQKRLLELAQGDYLAYVDGDDLALPGKLQAFADHFDRHPTCSLAYHEAEVFDSLSGEVTSHYSRDYYNAHYIPASATVEHLIRYGWFANASSVAFRRHDHLQEAVDPRCKIILDHPWHILNVLYGGGSIDFIPRILGRYRIHSQSFGGQTKRSPERREQVLADQLRACENARAFGVAEEIVAAGEAHYRFATALYFLKLDDFERFDRFLRESTCDDRFFDERHRQAWAGRADPQQVKINLFGATS